MVAIYSHYTGSVDVVVAEPKIPGTGPPPPTRLYPLTSLSAHLIQQVQPFKKKKARPKVAHPSSSVQPYSVTPPPSSSSWSPRVERPEVCRVAT